MARTRCSKSDRKINPNANSARQNIWKDHTKHSKVAKNFPNIKTLCITKILKTVCKTHLL